MTLTAAPLGNPAFRLTLAERHVAGTAPVPVDERILALVRVLRGQATEADADISFAYTKLYLRPFHRRAMEAFLITSASDDLVANNLQVTPGVVAVYRHLFFDTRVFDSKLDVLLYARDAYRNPDDQTIMQAAVMHGLQYVQWYYLNVTELTTREVARRMMTDAFFRGIAHRGANLTGSMAREAARWMQMATKNAETLERLEPRKDVSGVEQIRMLLEKRDDTFTPDTSPVKPEDVLH